MSDTHPTTRKIPKRDETVLPLEGLLRDSCRRRSSKPGEAEGLGFAPVNAFQFTGCRRLFAPLRDQLARHPGGHCQLLRRGIPPVPSKAARTRPIH
jgi:hypothetical protein